ncbi:MAG: hydrogenase assembly protein HupF [Candidatus Coatesbacteria bacterium 4484_99]|uniref:Hydrogenase assembly protein HupF n=1 Tax=Candidatus Coatesbacteria bacterium 4484_99 TaxID=1970774 RepID=A0A1W9S1I4_9BACT|nr:MAG: hydrogenase assembly protein HupF [Candidatus Coatesbacteria bacterium 4484_99]RLC40850.1 MAG: HypC/HybG/HupF family hydrogenase formation chaperone [Candidatus Coatesbacteria bacterium]RLC41789.1 MAG: HypC/HybG/HupF family hydrogenase formation chaperone [Candidatus Coatesbacteria bacterium]RLC42298.1 MAG: HypC/HybG/HupF family hydrogenase formation chaperone [Candidatus Coatesbacteria bacterium]HEC80625.1 HypC/HybG/HupF family hydrogenase formation chaperone [Bacillota bacterium]
MCLAIPARVLEIDGDMALVDLNGVRVRANLAFVDGVKVGSWVLLHTGFAISVLTEEEAMETFDILNQVFGGEEK